MTLLWTSPTDVSDRWLGGDCPADTAQLVLFLADAEDAILSEFPDLQDRLDEDELPLSRVKRVAARMVIRFLRNPDGTRSTQQTTGPFSESLTFAEAKPGAIALTDDDRAELARRSTTGRAFTIRVGSLD